VGLDRHYDTHRYRASGADLEIVQERLGHASIKTTTIYAKVTKEDKARAAYALAKAYRDSQQNSASGPSWPCRASVSARVRTKRLPVSGRTVLIELGAGTELEAAPGENPGRLGDTMASPNRLRNVARNARPNIPTFTYPRST